MMLVHSVVIMLVLFVVMHYGIGQAVAVAEDRSVAIGGLVLLYMVAFGHGLPKRLNPNLAMI